MLCLVRESARYLSAGRRGRGVHLPRANGLEEADHVTTEVPLALLQGRVEEQRGVLPAHRGHLHVLHRARGQVRGGDSTGTALEQARQAAGLTVTIIFIITIIIKPANNLQII